jgi:acyl dehydratase
MWTHFFEDLQPGMTFETPLTEPVSRSTVETYLAMTGDRFGIHCDDDFARAHGLREAMVPGNLLVALATGAVYANGHFSESLLVQARKTTTYRAPLYVNGRFMVVDRVVAVDERPGKPYGRVLVERTVIDDGGTVLLRIEQDYRVLHRAAAVTSHRAGPAVAVSAEQAGASRIALNR